MAEITGKGLSPIIQRYHASLGEKVTSIQAFSEDQSLLVSQKQELLQTLHKITGSGGMYGYDELSDKTRGLHESLSNSDADCEEKQTKLVKELNELISFINNIINSHS